MCADQYRSSPASTCVCIVAGGVSSRMNGVDKRELPHSNEQTFLEYIAALALQTAWPCFCLVDQTKAATLPPKVHAVVDRHPQSGPFVALQDFCRNEGAAFEQILVLPTDMPGLTSTTITNLMESAKHHPNAEALVTVAGGRHHHLFAIYCRSFFVDAEETTQSFKRRLTCDDIQSVFVDAIDLLQQDGDSVEALMMNVNTLEDLEKWRQL